MRILQTMILTILVTSGVTLPNAYHSPPPMHVIQCRRHPLVMPLIVWSVLYWILLTPAMPCSGWRPLAKMFFISFLHLKNKLERAILKLVHYSFIDNCPRYPCTCKCGRDHFQVRCRAIVSNINGAGKSEQAVYLWCFFICLARCLLNVKFRYLS